MRSRYQRVHVVLGAVHDPSSIDRTQLDSIRSGVGDGRWASSSKVRSNPGPFHVQWTPRPSGYRRGSLCAALELISALLDFWGLVRFHSQDEVAGTEFHDDDLLDDTEVFSSAWQLPEQDDRQKALGKVFERHT
jgi:hypothetical protein